MSLQCATSPEPEMDAPEITTASPKTETKLIDVPEEDLRNMSQQQLIALYKRAQQDRDTYKQERDMSRQELDGAEMVLVSLFDLADDFNDGTDETKGGMGQGYHFSIVHFGLNGTNLSAIHSKPPVPESLHKVFP
ncbi:hypothetical protein G6514_003468 [Epicoccum nigrum]|nr:hypothetical protein G6514_003468 [Epicoccum nigrum]